MLKPLFTVAFAALLLAACGEKNAANLNTNAQATSNVSVTADVSTSVSTTSTQTKVEETKTVVRNTYKKSQNINGLNRELEANDLFGIKAGEIVNQAAGMSLTLVESKDDYTITMRLEDVDGAMQELEFADPKDMLKKKYKGDKAVWKKAFLKAFEAEVGAIGVPPPPPPPPAPTTK